MNEYKIEKANLSKISKERLEFLKNNMYKIYFENNLQNYSDEKYLYWDKVKFLELPKDLESNEELWYIIKNMRFWIPTFIKNDKWWFFKIWKPNFLEELLHKLDLSLWWNFLDINFNKDERKIFLQNWIIEEAISSSQLEWAMTSSKVAREMITSNRKPAWRDEKMILNNYQAMNYVKDDLKNDTLDISKLLELQSILTNWTLEEPDQEWRLRKDSDEIVVQDKISWKIYHVPPSEQELYDELKVFIEYANDKEEWFTHPFLKAIILHFWIWYLHPFCDGNGRTARAIFYWYLLKKGYWGFSYIPISKLIKESKKKYSNAYIYSEQDDYDLTYFLVYISNKTNQSFKEFSDYVLSKQKKQKIILGDLLHLWFNERQNKLITYFLENKKWYTNNMVHKNYYWISINTAKSDLESLLDKWYLKKEKSWKYVNYYPTEILFNLLD